MHTHPFLRSIALFYRALSNERRLYILIRLVAVGSMTNDVLRKELKIHHTAVSRHLHILLQAGLVQSKRKGREVYFSFNTRFMLKGILSMTQLLTTR